MWIAVDCLSTHQVASAHETVVAADGARIRTILDWTLVSQLTAEAILADVYRDVVS